MSSISPNKINQDIETLNLYLEKSWSFRNNQHIEKQIDLNDLNRMTIVVQRCMQYLQTSSLTNENRTLIEKTCIQITFKIQTCLSDLALSFLFKESNNYMAFVAIKIRDIEKILQPDLVKQKYTLKFSDNTCLTFSEDIMRFLKQMSPIFEDAFAYYEIKSKKAPLLPMSKDSFLNTLSVFHRGKMHLTLTDLNDMKTFLNNLRLFRTNADFFLSPSYKEIVDFALKRLINVFLAGKHDHLIDKFLNTALSVFEPREYFPAANAALDQLIVYWFLAQIEDGRNYTPPKEISSRVQILDIWNCKISENKARKFIRTFSNCIHLNCSLIGKLTDVINTSLYRELTNLNHLQTLEIKNYKRLTNEDLHYISQLQNLVTLNLSNSKKITDEGLSHLTTLQNLRDLYLSSCVKLTNAAMIHVKQLLNLHTLDLSWIDNLTDEALVHIEPLTNLQMLDISWDDRISDQALSHLTPLTLYKLNLKGNILTTQSLIYITHHLNMRVLNVKECGLIDAHVAQLVVLSHLEDLDLSDNDLLTDQCLVHLAMLKNLHTVDFTACTKITEKALDQIQRPKLHIFQY